VTVGGEYLDNFTQNQNNYNTDPFIENLDDKRRSNNWGIYLQDEFTIRKDLILNAGIRYDRYQTFGDTTNPRLALIYKPVNTTAVKLIYGEAFRAPSAYENHYHDGWVSQKPRVATSSTRHPFNNERTSHRAICAV